MRRKHDWVEREEDGTKREVRVTRTGPVWKFQSKIKGEEDWTYYERPLRVDLETFRDILERKYRRKRASYDDVKILERMITEREGE